MRNNYEVKNVKTVRGHEGEPLIHCSVYLNGKRIGFYSSGDWGGPGILHEMTRKDMDEIQRFAKKFLSDSYVEAYSIFIEEMAERKLFAQKMKRISKTRCVYRTNKQNEDEAGTLTLPYNEKTKQKIHAFLDKEYGAGNYKILNGEL
jgi:hypothetical protein